ncbi:MAG: GNAT family N-acetyltransferase [Armatimonadota bacterium]|nr:GNAT family N-acetyltransferase [Armatimonadota bacterium]
MERIAVWMIRESLENIPEYPLPAGYGFRTFHRGDERVWAEIQARAGNFESVDKALEHFEHEFSNSLPEFERRCLFLIVSATSEAVGSTTAWFDPDYRGKDHGRIHWVAIVPEYQGRGLAKPMLAEAMKLLRQWHERAYLATHTGCLKAINMYLDFGFVPDMTKERAAEAWRLIADAINHPVLNRLLEGEEA